MNPAFALPLVFVHGFGGAPSEWDAQVRYFEASHQVVAADWNEALAPGLDCLVRRAGTLVAALLTEGALKDAVLIGHSMGCRIVAEAAAQERQKIKSLVLIDGSLTAAGAEARLMRQLQGENGYATFLESFFGDMLSGANAATVTAARERAAKLGDEIGGALAIDIVRFDQDRFREALSVARVPVLVLQATTPGEAGRRRPFLSGDRSGYIEMLRASAPYTEVVALPHAGHYAHVDAADEANVAIASFVERLDILQN